MEDILFIILIFLCFFTSFFYNKKDKFIKRFFKSFLHTFCIYIISLLFLVFFGNIGYDLQDKYGYDSLLPKIFELMSYISLYCIPIVYNLAVLIAIKKDKH